MSVLGIAGSSLFSLLSQIQSTQSNQGGQAQTNQVAQSKRQQFRQEFQQLGQDLQSGNLSAAQSTLPRYNRTPRKAVRLADRRKAIRKTIARSRRPSTNWRKI